ncbi:uroporphyrinogen decarboxylase family protein [Sporomusa sp.]|uniref:uroporphyrinogen decarboxylase family protein n=1 Tax=Sporomusa sp. TaxID=2078658 RepID=UPI002BFFA8A8|nr:uroporphyrinogen decarboxylase family protein [Sporomusa sp.]HWR08693.1 uroporphyrinogen decarboxylase family protein [Sporomusa sp.]
MEVTQTLFAERMARLEKAIALEKPDRTPIMLSGTFFLKYGNPQAKMVDFITRPDWADDMVINGYQKMADVDAGGPPVLGRADATGAMWLSKTKIPGRELPDDAFWQIDEVGLMTEEDYDTILKIGWRKFLSDFLISRLGYTPEQITPDLEFNKRQDEKFKSIGLVNLLDGIGGGIPYDALCSGRGLAKFNRDLYKRPDKVKAVLEVMVAEMVEDEIKFLRARKPFCTVVVPCVRANCDFLSRKMFEKFGWPLFKKFTDIAIAEGVKVLFHMDARWDDFLDYFTDFPKGSCIFDPDSSTNIYRIKEVLGDRMCITGDVSPAMLTVGTPDAVYKYSRKLIEEIGPSGFILSSGCTVPCNAKPENVEALVAAAKG